MPRKNQNPRTNRKATKPKGFPNLSPELHRRRSCSGKRCYVSKTEALGTIEYLGKTGDLVPYDCEFCRGIHIGHKR